MIKTEFWKMKLKIMTSFVFSATEPVIEIRCQFLEQTKHELHELGKNAICMVEF